MNAAVVMTVAQVLAGVLIVMCSVLSWAAMGQRTRHCFRAVYGVMGVGGLALVLMPVYGDEPWHAGALLALLTVLVFAQALYMALDRRRIGVLL